MIILLLLLCDLVVTDVLLVLRLALPGWFDFVGAKRKEGLNPGGGGSSDSVWVVCKCDRVL